MIRNVHITILQILSWLMEYVDYLIILITDNDDASQLNRMLLFIVNESVSLEIITLEGLRSRSWHLSIWVRSLLNLNRLNSVNFTDEIGLDFTYYTSTSAFNFISTICWSRSMDSSVSIHDALWCCVKARTRFSETTRASCCRWRDSMYLPSNYRS